MVDTHFKSKQNQFLHLDTKKILSAPLYIFLDFSYTLSDAQGTPSFWLWYWYFDPKVVDLIIFVTVPPMIVVVVLNAALYI